MEHALKRGCKASRVLLYQGSDTEFEVRNEQLDRLQQSTERQMAFHLFVDGKYGAFSTNRLVKEELTAFIDEAVEAVKYLAPDPNRKLPSPELYFSGNAPSLQLFDEAHQQVSPDQKLSLAKEVAAEILGADKRLLSVQSSWSDGRSMQYLVSSNGFEGEHEVTYYSLSACVSVKGKGDARPEAFWYDQALTFNNLIKQGIGKEALGRALSKIGQQKVDSGKYTLLVDNMNSGRLLSPILSAINGPSLQQNNSFLLNKLNQYIVSEKVTLVDEPHVPGAFGSRWFDNEGVATQHRYIIEFGVLRTYFLDTYFALKMKMPQTISGPSRLVLKPGVRSCEAMMSDVEKGILVTGFNGGNCNSNSGDFSFGVEGFLIENGIIVRPIAEMNITGNMLSLWASLQEIGNDPRRNNAYLIPSLLFTDVNLSGS